MKHLRKFSNLAAKEAAIIHRPCVSLIEDTMDIVYDPLYYFNPRYLYTDGSISTTLDSSKTVMGVEVIPASHMSDGKARFVSVKNMSRFAGEVETGTTAIGDDVENNGGTSIPWGNLNEDITEMVSYPSTGYKLKTSEDAITEENTQGLINELSSNKDVYLATDQDTGISGNNFPFFPNTFLPGWTDFIGREYIKIPLPYPFNIDGTRNTMYWNNGEGMAITDMDGNSNTSTLINRIDSSITWSEGDALNVTVGVAGQVAINHPAAVACRRFHGGKVDTAGKWYLPSAGELGYLMANVAKINAKIEALPSGQGVRLGVTSKSIDDTDTLGYYLWSSTENSKFYAYTLSTLDGGLGNKGTGKDYADYGWRVRAFLAV